MLDDDLNDCGSVAVAVDESRQRCIACFRLCFHGSDRLIMFVYVGAKIKRCY